MSLLRSGSAREDPDDACHFVACTERSRMSEQDPNREQVDEAQDDIELPEEKSEEVKGGAIQKAEPGSTSDFAGNKKI
jgi:hypothetical protein